MLAILALRWHELEMERILVPKKLHGVAKPEQGPVNAGSDTTSQSTVESVWKL